ncbi:MAG: hypothetical protein U0174_23655 [Polyangiaceae bacterium]
MKKLGLPSLFASLSLLACAEAATSGEAGSTTASPSTPNEQPGAPGTRPPTEGPAPAVPPAPTGTTSSSSGSSSGHTEPPAESTKVGQLLVMQADHDVTQVRSFASEGNVVYSPSTTFGACHIRPTAISGNATELEPPKDLTFVGGNSLSPISLVQLLPNAGKPRGYDDNRNLNVGGSPTWLAAGETLSAQSAATVDVPAIAFPALAWPSRVILASSPSFSVVDTGARSAGNVPSTSDASIAWTVDDAVDAGSVTVQLSRRDNTLAVDCVAPTGDRAVTVPAAALAALGAGPAYLFIASYNHASVAVPGFKAYNYVLHQMEAGRNIKTNASVTFTIQ